MISKKTIKLSENNKITFIFYKICFTIHVCINNITTTIMRDHSDYNQILSELKNDYNLDDHLILLVDKWFDKNYKKLYPNKQYVTKYGRLIINKIN